MAQGDKKDKKDNETSDGEEAKKLKKEKRKEERERLQNQSQDESSQKKTNLGDSANIKRILDDAVIKVLLDPKGKLGYEEDVAMSNVKLVVGFSAVGSSLVSHVYPATFPKNYWVLLACCAYYFICSTVLQFILSFWELESILLLRPQDRTAGKDKCLNISSHFPRFQEVYTLGITPVPGGSLFLATAPTFVPNSQGSKTSGKQPLTDQRSWSVNHYFDEDGEFYEDLFIETVRDFISEFQRSNQLGKKVE